LADGGIKQNFPAADVGIIDHCRFAVCLFEAGCGYDRSKKKQYGHK
jgi:hypothetical protein